MSVNNQGCSSWFSVHSEFQGQGPVGKSQVAIEAGGSILLEKEEQQQGSNAFKDGLVVVNQ